MYDSQYGTPIILTPGVPSISLPRLSFSKETPDSYNEAWLQEMLFANPAAIPIDQLDRSYEDLVPICQELSTPAGYLDLLYATPKGRLVLLEAKLWRNPEARRKVIGQILDYANEMSGWSYEDLQREVSKVTKEKGNCLFEIVRRRFPGIDEAAFVDEVTRSLRAGRFMLLIVGDGIREGAGAIAGFLERSGTLQFTFGLVEMAIYALPDGGRLVHPRILARSVEVQRSVIVLTDERLALESPGIVNEQRDNDPEQNEATARIAELWDGFLQQLRLDDQAQPLPTKSRDSNLYFPMPTKSQAWMSAWLGIWGGNGAGVRLKFTKSPEASAMYDELLSEREKIDVEVGLSLSWEALPDGKHSIGIKRQFGPVFDPANRPEIYDFLSDAVNRMVNAFRPRLARLVANSATS